MHLAWSNQFMKPAGPVAPLPLPANVASMNFIGDSFTFGEVATTTAQRYSSLVAASMGAAEINNGISGTLLQNLKDESGNVRANNGRNRWFSALIQGGGVMKVIAYGGNDGRYTGTAGNTGELGVVNYQVTLDALVVDLLLQGTLPQNIVIISPWWLSDTGLVTGSAGFTGQSRAVYETFVAAAAAVAAKYGVYFYNAYTYMRDNGGAALISGDNIHPTDAGHAIIAQGFMLATRVPATYVLPTAFVQDSMYGQANAALTSRAGEIGAAWVVQPGSAPGTPSAIDSTGRLWSPTPSGNYQSIGVAPANGNYHVEVGLPLASVLAGDRVGVTGRASDSAATYYFADYDRSANQYRLFSVVGGTSTPLGTFVEAYASGLRRIRLTMINDQISVSRSIDGGAFGVIIGPVTNTAIPATQPGRAGIRQATVQTNIAGMHPDDFLALAA